MADRFLIPVGGDWESDASDIWSGETGGAPDGGRLYSPLLAGLTLEVYYRYLPMYSK